MCHRVGLPQIHPTLLAGKDGIPGFATFLCIKPRYQLGIKESGATRRKGGRKLPGCVSILIPRSSPRDRKAAEGGSGWREINSFFLSLSRHPRYALKWRGIRAQNLNSLSVPRIRASLASVLLLLLLFCSDFNQIT